MTQRRPRLHQQQLQRPVQSQNDEIARLKATLAEQQKQLQALQQSLQNQQALLEKAISAQPADGNSGSRPGYVQRYRPGRFHHPDRPDRACIARPTPVIPVAPLAGRLSRPGCVSDPVAARCVVQRHHGQSVRRSGVERPRSGVPPARQRLHRSDRLHGLDAVLARQERRHPAWVPTSAAFLITTRPTATFRNSTSASRTRASVSASTATGRAPTSSATTSSTSTEPAARLNLAVYKRRHRSSPSPVLGRCPQGQDRVPRRTELEPADAQPQRPLGAARRPVLQPSHRHQLHRGPHLDAPARYARPLSPERQGDLRAFGRAGRPVHRRFGRRRRDHAAVGSCRPCAATQLDNGAGYQSARREAIWRSPPYSRTSSPSWHSIPARASTSKSAAS